MNKKLEETIEQTLKTMEKSKDWQKAYDEQAKVLSESKTLLDQFYKKIKGYEQIQFYLVEVTPVQDNILTIEARYKGQQIAIIKISKDKTTISTNPYNETNKKIFNCDLELDEVNLDTKETYQFLEFYNKDRVPQGKIQEQSRIQAMFLDEFSKTKAYDKLLLGIQPIKYGNLFVQIPTLSNNEYIDILTRTKIRKLTIIENLDKDKKPDEILSKATEKAIFLFNLLRTNQGQQWYKNFGFHGRVTPHLTIKVVLAVPKQLEGKCKEFDPFELRAGTDSIEFYHLTYEADQDNITSIHTKLNS